MAGNKSARITSYRIRVGAGILVLAEVVVQLAAGEAGRHIGSPQRKLWFEGEKPDSPRMRAT
jgi:hypothetical protein